MKFLALLLISVPTISNAFFMLGTGGCGCSAPPSCPPPPPPPVCAPAPSCGCHAVAHGARTVPAYAALKTDELDMRATAFGIPIQSDGTNIRNIEQLERLGEQYAHNVDASSIPIEKIEDADLFAALKKSTDIRRAPVVSVTKQDEITTTTVATETNKVKGEESKPANDKCNSEVLHKLMLEHISDNSSESKRKINVAAEAKFSGNVDVVCSRGHFSYVFSSNLYCEATKGLTTCIAYRQAA